MVESKDAVTRQEHELTTFRALKILTWKYTTYRKYYWTWTLFEFLLPICLGHIVLRVSEVFIGSDVKNRNVIAAANNITFRMLAESTLSYDKIFYHTESIDGVLLIMAAVKNIGDITGTYTNSWVEYSEELVALAVLTFEGRTVGIVFEECYPNLRYKIREKFLWNTTLQFSEEEIDNALPNIGSNPYLNLGFIGLQYFINTAFMQRVNDESYAARQFSFRPKNDDVISATFPYPEYTATPRYHYKFPIVVAVLLAVTSLMVLGPLMYTIIDEKSRGMNEMMILTGLPQKCIWMGWFINTLVPAVLMYTIIVYLQLKFDYRGAEYIAIRFVQSSLLWALVVLYFAAQLAFCFTFCTIFHSTLFGILSFFVITMILGFGAAKAYDYRNLVLVHLSCLCPIGALIQGFKRISYYEILELNITWDLVFLNEFTAADASLGFVLVLLIIDIPLYLLLTYYINSINPGRYGIKKSPFFLFQQKNSAGAGVVDEKKFEESHEGKHNPFVNLTTPNANVVLKLSNVTKKIGNLKGVNLSMNSNEIYVIVGPLLAGKTSLVSLITGLSKITEGKIFYNGVNLDTSINELRKFLGYCPQENRLFKYFQVMDHLMLFGRLKGLEENDALVEAHRNLDLMGIKSSADDTVLLLSAENIRKVSLTIALMGASKILIMDEPTTGLNMVSQRRILNVLKELKKSNRTIIMTTPFINDAIAVGDRIAIINYGVVQCEGSISFLQSKFGVGGYYVMITKEDAPVTISGRKDDIQQSITQIIKVVPGATIVHLAPTEIFLKFPANTAKFPDVFKALEGKRKTLNIEHITVSCITLETVYSRIGGESIYNPDGTPIKLSEFIEEEIKLRQAAVQHPNDMEKLEGFALLLEQHKVLFMKKAIFSYRRWDVFLYRVVIPTILLTILLRTPSKYFDLLEKPLKLSLQAYSGSTVLTVNHSNTHGVFLDLLLDYLDKSEVTSTVVGNKSTVDGSFNIFK